MKKISDQNKKQKKSNKTILYQFQNHGTQFSPKVYCPQCREKMDLIGVKDGINIFSHCMTKLYVSDKMLNQTDKSFPGRMWIDKNYNIRYDFEFD